MGPTLYADRPDRRTAERDVAMITVWRLLSQIWADTRGISAVEYALLLSMIAAGLVLSVDRLSESIEGEIFETAACLATGDANSEPCQGSD